MTATHFVPYDSPGRRIAQALCGLFVDRSAAHAPQPSCAACQASLRALAADDEELAATTAHAAPAPRRQSARAPAPVWHGHISDDGRFGLLETERADRQAYFKTLAGTDVDIVVTPHRDTRSDRANRYYWSCVLTPMSKEHSEGDQSPEEIHDAMCQLFLPDEKKRVAFFNRLTGESLAVDTDPRRSSRLTGDAFYTFVEQVRKFALEFLNVRTEDPDPAYWRKRSKAA